MKAIVFHGIGDIRLDDVKEPKIKNRYDAIVRLTASAICGTDLQPDREFLFFLSLLQFTSCGGGLGSSCLGNVVR
jgi:Alcohol dehydrogenase GroES-associated